MCPSLFLQAADFKEEPQWLLTPELSFDLAHYRELSSWLQKRVGQEVYQRCANILLFTRLKPHLI